MKKKELAWILLFSGLLLFSLEFQKRIDLEQINNVMIDDYFQTEEETPEETEDEKKEEKNIIPTTPFQSLPISQSTSKKENYMGILEIPKISLKQGFFAYDSSQNNVQKNIQLLSFNCNPTLPCALILASHSGNSSISYFHFLDQLEIDDVASIYYQDQVYTYVLSKIDTMNKVGVFTALKPSQSELILTTCDEQNDVQDLYYFELKKA